MTKRFIFKSSTINKYFGEHILRKDQGPRTIPRVDFPRWVLLASILIVFTFFALARLVDLQIIRGAYFFQLAEGNRIRRIPLKAPRGEILDRNGRSLARNLPVYKLATFSRGGVVQSTKIISREEALRIQATDPEQSTRIILDTKREYPLGKAAAHLIGYVNEIGSDEIGEKPTDCRQALPYQLGDLKGRMGIEAQYDCVLRGVNGEELIEVDTKGRLVRRLGRKEPIPGSSIRLTIDSDLQKAAYEALVNAPNAQGTGRVVNEGEVVKGGFIAQDSATGEVLALVSVPSFDPNRIGEFYQKWIQDKNLPLFNRVISGLYPPGSTFKIVTAAAGLEEGKIDKNYQYEDKGFIKVNNFLYRNWYYTQYGRTEGFINVVRALARSTDTFFYKLGELVHVSGLVKWARKFGFGQATGIDLPGEANGFVPTPEWKKRVKSERWFLGNTYHLAIGQADLLATPLQVNQMTGIIASGGKLCVPYVRYREGKQANEANGLKPCYDIGISRETIETITQGMLDACSVGGTAFPFFSFQPHIACKTGTAQIGSTNKTHAWLTAFVPSQSQQDLGSFTPDDGLTVTALVEGGGEGSRVAAPVVRDVLETWVRK